MASCAAARCPLFPSLSLFRPNPHGLALPSCALCLPRHPPHLSRHILVPLPKTKSSFVALFPFTLLQSCSIRTILLFHKLKVNRLEEKSLSLAPYFPPHTPRNVYLSLLHLQDHDPSAAKVPDSLLRAALLARCTEDIHRIIHIRTRKQALNTLLKRGSVGDEIWQRLLRAEQELEAEVKDCVQEVRLRLFLFTSLPFPSLMIAQRKIPNQPH